MTVMLIMIIIELIMIIQCVPENNFFFLFKRARSSKIGKFSKPKNCFQSGKPPNYFFSKGMDSKVQKLCPEKLFLAEFSWKSENLITFPGKVKIFHGVPLNPCFFLEPAENSKPKSQNNFFFKRSGFQSP